MRALELYAKQSLAVRLHTRIRASNCPMHAVLARAPREGRVLEVGCGHGLFANELALRRSSVDVLGIDPAPPKIHAAQATVGARENVAFRAQRVEDLDDLAFDAIAILDVLYLVPRADWHAFLEACRARLRPGGRLLLKEVDVRPRWKFYRCALQEALVVRGMGVTFGEGMTYASSREMPSILTRAGFVGVRVSDLSAGYLTPHVLYEARSP